MTAEINGEKANTARMGEVITKPSKNAAGSPAQHPGGPAAISTARCPGKRAADAQNAVVLEECAFIWAYAFASFARSFPRCKTNC